MSVSFESKDQEPIEEKEYKCEFCQDTGWRWSGWKKIQCTKCSYTEDKAQDILDSL